MFFDWLAREGGIVLSWWALVTLAGVAIFPMLSHLLHGLPDRGYTLARAAGLLVVSFVFWLLACLGLLRNTPGSIILSWGIVLALSLTLYFRSLERLDLRAWWSKNRTVVLAAELLFIILLFGWAIYRANIPDLRATEKPMEMAFLSGVMRSETFPPNDPWMAGYAISYYYFGYVMAAMFSNMSGVTSTIGFNMTVAMWFALTGLTTFGVVSNLARARASKASMPIVAGLLGTFFVVLMGNFQLPLIELPYQNRSISTDYLSFWSVNERLEAKPPLDIGGVDVAGWDYWWWFRASRVVTDYDLNGVEISVQPITEFPAFSFLLADNHPHVLALPFALLALGLAVNLLFTGHDPTRSQIVFYGLCVGALVFLNTWDGPIYMAALVGADALRRLIRGGSGMLTRSDMFGLIRFGLWLLGLTAVLYIPFLVTFRSQASGVLPNLVFPTMFGHFFLVFGPFILLLTPFLTLTAVRGGRRMNWRLGVQVALGIVGLFIVILLMFTLIGTLVPDLRATVLSFVDQNGGWGQVLPRLLERRLSNITTTLVLMLALIPIIARLFPKSPTLAEMENVSSDERQVVQYTPSEGFALMLVGMGVILTLAPEFVYLRDNFGVRINTIFKFYYQAWVVFGVAAAYGVYAILADERKTSGLPAFRFGFSVLVIMVVAAGALYPLFGIYSRAYIERGRATSSVPLTLDGGSNFIHPNDYLSITCLGDLVQGDNVVAVEAVGGPYNEAFGRVGALTGIPTLIGWENHEAQWRGPTYMAVRGTRPEDIRTLYTDLRWDAVQPIIDRYDIDYIFYGTSERSTYGAQGEQKFEENLEVVCDFDGSRFYQVRAGATTQVAG